MNDTTNQLIDPQIRQLAFSPARLRTVDDFECDKDIIGEGTYGKVIKARDKRTNEIVALKKIQISQKDSGLPITSVREIKLLKSLRHENIVTLKEVILDTPTNKNTNNEAIFLVFEYMEHDLSGLNKLEGIHFTSGQIACYAKQLLEGLYYCHKKKVLHRDIKGANMLVNKDGILKLADFGLARKMRDGAGYTRPVVTLWYRAPELLLGTKTYTSAIDMWSIGCLLVELYTQEPLFPGQTDAEQINKIFSVCGTPSDDNWPEGLTLPIFKTLNLRYTHKRKLRTYLENSCKGRISKDGIDLLDQLLSLDPKKRPSAENALDHPLFFGKEVSSIEDIPKYSDKTYNELHSKKFFSNKSSRPIARDQPPFKKVRGNNYNYHRSNNGHYNNNHYNQNREYRPRNDYNNNRGRRGYNGQRRSRGNPEYNPRNIRRGYNNNNNNRYQNRDQRPRYNNQNYNQNYNNQKDFQKDHQNDTPSSTHAEPPRDYREVEIPTDNETV